MANPNPPRYVKREDDDPAWSNPDRAVKSVQGTKYENIAIGLDQAPSEKRNLRTFAAELIQHDNRTIVHVFCKFKPVGLVQQVLGKHFSTNRLYEFAIGYTPETKGHEVYLDKPSPAMLIDWIWKKLGEVDAELDSHKLTRG